MADIKQDDTMRLLNDRRFSTGLAMLGGMAIYFLVRATLPQEFMWPGAGKFIAILTGAAGGAFLVWLVLRFTGVNKHVIGIIVPVVFLWFVLFGIFFWCQRTVQVRWEFFLYMLITVIGSMLLYSGIRRHFISQARPPSDTGPTDWTQT